MILNFLMQNIKGDVRALVWGACERGARLGGGNNAATSTANTHMSRANGVRRSESVAHTLAQHTEWSSSDAMRHQQNSGGGGASDARAHVL